MFTLRFGLLTILPMALALVLTGGCATDLHRAVENNSSPSSVERALDGGADPNVRNEFGSTPLHIAMGEDADTELVKVLVEGGADVNAVNDDGDTPLHDAAWFSDDTAKVELLLDAGADTEIGNKRGETPLHRAAAHGEIEIIELLLDYGADINAINDSGRSPLHESLTTRQIFIEDGLGVARLLLERGASPNDRALWRFATPGVIVNEEQDMGDPEIVALLLEYGADANMTDPNYGPLLIAVGSLEIARLLIEHGADVNAADSYIAWTPMHGAATAGDAAMLTLLLDSGADVNVVTTDNNRHTPLSLAVVDRDVETTELLLNRGADPSIGRPTCRSAQSAEAFAGTAALERLCADEGRQADAGATPTPEPLGLIGMTNSAIHGAVLTESPDFVAALLDEGIPIEAGATITLTDDRTLHGVTLLHVAVFNRDPAVIDLLLDRGANINAMTTTGETPCDLARQVDRLAGTAALDRLCGG